MAMNWIDWIGFVGFSLFVIVYAMYKSRKENTAEDYFLGGRSMGWILVGFSLIASNISSEHFVGMSGAAFGGAGLAIASYEYIAAVTLVFIAFFLLPLYLKTGIYTLPEFLQFRYGKEPRTLMAFYMMIAYCGVALAAVLYAGAIALKAMFGLDLAWGIWAVGLSAGLYTAFGGLKAVAWSDLLHGAALLLGGTVVTVIGLSRVGGVGEFFVHNRDKFHLILPANHPDIPWTALLVGIWIPNLFYWGLNQFITQRALAAKSLAQGQLGIMFAAFMKIFIPFIIVLPGIIAYELYRDKITTGDMAYPTLIKEIIPFGLRGMLLAALSGAVMSALSALLNSASTIWTMDFYKPYLNKTASPEKVVQIGRISTVVFTIIACLMAPLPGKFEGVFRYIQMIWGFISPGIVAVFVFGLLFRKAPKSAAMAAMIIGPVIYGILLKTLPKVAFLNHMAITFAILCVVMGVVTAVKPLAQPVEFTMKGEVDLKSSPLAKILGVIVVITVALFYIVLR
jgi:SSS family solute:Na+ symporter